MRKFKSLTDLSRVPLALAAGCAILAGCSADVTRFDYPALGLSEEPRSTGSLTVPPEPITPYAPNDQSRPYQATAPDPNWGGTFNSGGRQSGVNTDYGADYRSTYPSQVTPGSSQGTYSYGGAARATPTYQAPRINDAKPLERRRSYSTSNAAASKPADVYEVTPSYEATPSYAASSSSGDSIKVAPGDTLYGIARQHGVSVSALMSANNLNNSSIRVGQTLVMPGSDSARSVPTRQVATRTVTTDVAPATNTTRFSSGGDTYRVAPGDSLYAISRRHDVTVAALQDANDLSDPSKLRVGQTLIIPNGSGGRATTTASRATAASRATQRLPVQRRTPDALPSFNASTPAREPERTAALAPSNRTSTGSAGANDDAGDTGGQFRWPVKGRIVTAFGRRGDGSHNDGINIAVPAGTSVRAVADGVVAYAGDELKGYGNLVLVRHDDNWVSAYAHNDSLMVSRGDKIRRGEVIAKAGRSGTVDQPQVHFELRKGSKPVDPLLYLAKN